MSEVRAIGDKLHLFVVPQYQQKIIDMIEELGPDARISLEPRRWSGKRRVKEMSALLEKQAKS